MKFLIASLLLFITSFSYSQTDSTEIWSGTITRIANPDGGMEGLKRFINKNFSKEAKRYLQKNKIKGKIFVILIVEKDGSIRDVKISKGLESVVDEEVLRVIKLTKWSPAYCYDMPVATKFAIPITF